MGACSIGRGGAGRRTARRALALAAVAFSALAGAATGQPDPQQMVADLERQYPPGSVTTPALADNALLAARAVHESLQVQLEAQRRRCANVFFVNRCLDAARHTQRAGEHVVRAVTLEAHDLQRHRDAQLHAESRAQALRDEAAENLQRPERERQAALNARTREQNASAREADEKRDLERAAQDSAAAEARAQAHVADVARKDAARPSQEAASLREYREKQDQAAAYARTRAEDREANAKRRADRQKTRDAQTAAQRPAPASASPPAQAPGPVPAPGPASAPTPHV